MLEVCNIWIKLLNVHRTFRTISGGLVWPEDRGNGD